MNGQEPRKPSSPPPLYRHSRAGGNPGGGRPAVVLSYAIPFGIPAYAGMTVEGAAGWTVGGRPAMVLSYAVPFGIPAYAGMTVEGTGMTVGGGGMDGRQSGMAVKALFPYCRRLDSRLRGNDGSGAGMTVAGAGMTVGGGGMDGIRGGGMTAIGTAKERKL